ncbi:hypothetical protein ABLA30_01245 [Xenorhabdus nematophila]
MGIFNPNKKVGILALLVNVALSGCTVELQRMDEDIHNAASRSQKK